MEGFYVMREHEVRMRELEERALLFRDVPRRPRRWFSWLRRRPVTTHVAPEREPLNPWDATYIRAA
ncbi:MAG: hypothetical protein M0R74_08405 [Dehalococcoidia bacterium]|nr:hypothetical protein [Dehalococcoidia bacterium]